MDAKELSPIEEELSSTVAKKAEATQETAKLEASALSEHGSFAVHFRTLCVRCFEALEQICAVGY